MKLTKVQMRHLSDLQGRNYPLPWTGPSKAMGNKLVKLGLATYSAGYPHGFAITDAGRSALEAQDEPK